MVRELPSAGERLDHQHDGTVAFEAAQCGVVRRALIARDPNGRQARLRQNAIRQRQNTF
jgi:hypothetical protein